MAPVKIKTAFNSQPAWQQFIIVLLFNTLIAVLIKIIIPNSDFLNQISMSQSIGLSIFLSYLISASLFEIRSWKILLPLFIGAPVGVAIGIVIQVTVLNASFELVLDELKNNLTNILALLFSALFFGAILLAFFVYREHIFNTKSRLQEEKIHNLDHQKTIAETSLRLLQAQIEPHFLFNTLSNVISLIDTEPKKSKHLLESLTEFLRASLKRSTDTDNNLNNEIALIRHYLAIMKIRFGQRLEYKIEVQENTEDCVFPPLLLQPLVENAIIHGIEPLTEGGRINITIERTAQVLRITVTDTGRGLPEDITTGFGLSNIRNRLRTFYRDRGKLSIEENNPTGVIARIEVPYEPI